jgi:N-acetylglucosaminyldiphosphoundecaprenol N-acetyl-beta-D-mannosaminyltransferase
MTSSTLPVAPLRPPIAILGVPFDHVTTAETLALIEAMIASRRPHYLVTANVDFVVQAQNDTELRRILLDAHLVVADGMPLVWASRWLGHPLPERVTGSGMTPLLLAQAEVKGWRVFFLGGTEQSVAQAAANTRARHPRLEIAGAYSPPFKPLLEMDHDDILRRLQTARPDLLLVAFGCPKQEKWLNMHYRAAGVPVAIGVGATIDFLAGTMKRAPVWMQQAGLEWVFRLLQEPRRLFRRYVTDLWVFGWAILAQLHALRARQVHPPPATTLEVTRPTAGDALSIRLPPRWDSQAVHAQTATWQTPPAGDVLLEVGAVEFIDSTGVGALVRWHKHLRESGKSLVLVTPSPALRQALALMKLDTFFAAAPDGTSAQALLRERRSERPVVVGPGGADATLRLAWQGEVIAATLETVAATTLARLAEARGPVVINLSAVRFIDSSGVGLMVRLRKEAQRLALDLSFAEPPAVVRNVARLLRLEDYLFTPTP